MVKNIWKSLCFILLVEKLVGFLIIVVEIEEVYVYGLFGVKYFKIWERGLE